MGKTILKKNDEEKKNVPLIVKKFIIIKKPKEYQKQKNEDTQLFKIAQKQNNQEETIICEVTQKIDFPKTSKTFEQMVKSGFPFIDETLLVKDIMEDCESNILISRPRRWMKSINMSMIKTFLQVNQNTNNENIFNGLKIQKCSQFCQKHFRKHPVIFITFPTIVLNDYENIYKQIDQAFRQPIASAFYDNKNIYEENILSKQMSEKNLERFQLYLEQSQTIDINNGITYLSQLLFEYYNKKVIILIDEFDCPINSLLGKEHFDSILDFMNKFLTMNIKNNNLIEKTICTGVLNIGFQQLLSGFNCLSQCGVNHNKFSRYFGFSQEDVDYLLSKIYDSKQQSQLNQVKEQLKLWYEGYIIGNRKMYNPQSVLNCLSNLIQKNEKIYQPYWTFSGNKSILMQVLTKMKNPQILFNGLINFDVDSLLNNSFDLQNREESLSIIYQAGYLTMDKKTGQLKIPNSEIKIILQKILMPIIISQQNNHNEQKVFEIIQSITKSLCDIKMYKDSIQKNILTSLGSENKNEIFFQSYIGTIFYQAERLDIKPTHKVQLEVFSGKGRIDQNFWPIQNMSDLILNEEYKLLSKFKDIYYKMENVFWQMYTQMYQEHSLNKIQNKQISFISKIAFRGVIFIQDEIDNRWTVEIQEYIHSIENAKQLYNIFKQIKQSQLLLQKTNLQERNIQRQQFLNSQGVNSLHQLILKHSISFSSTFK